MKLTIKYFGLLAEVTDCVEEHIEFSGTLINDVLEHIYLKYPKLKKTDFQVAQSNHIVSKKTLVSGSEIALLPPFAGG